MSEKETFCMVTPDGRVMSGGNGSNRDIVVGWFLRECVHANGRSMEDYEAMGYSVQRFVAVGG